MLEQHPVPQNVTSFQFRLIGDMTLKQFGYLAGGAILAYIAYNLPLPIVFTWPLTALFGLGGVGFAFVPVEQRPMDVWFLSFIRSVYSPTLYIWQREATSVSLQKSNSNTTIPHLPTKALSSSLLSKNVWSSFFSKKAATKPDITIFASTKTPTPGSVAAPQPQPQPQPQPPLPAPEPQNHIPTNGGQTPTSSVEKQLENALADKQRLEAELASIRLLLEQKQSPQTSHTQPNTSPPPQPYVQKTPPNMISGIVKGQTGEPLHSILVTVKNSEDTPLRALKTNKMGVFASSTPLPNGTYTIDVEDPKGNFFFQPASVTLDGNPIQQVVVVAKTQRDLERQKLADVLFGKQA